MKLENQVCSLEQAKRLKELGVTGAEFFLWLEVARFDNNGNIAEWLPALFIERQYDPECVSVLPAGCVNEDDEIMESRGSYPAFTVAELGVMLPDIYFLPVNKGDKGWWTKDGVFHPTEAQARASILINTLHCGTITPTSVNQRLSND